MELFFFATLEISVLTLVHGPAAPIYRAMGEQATAWLILILGYALPLLHVALSPAGGPWTPPAGARCPLGPRVGWIVIVVLLGPIGWLLYMRARAKRHSGEAAPSA